jgi:tetratricopeptide (TPR) repeat protein
MVFGIVLAYQENITVAQPALEESMALFRKVEDQWGYAVAMMSLGYAVYKKEDETTSLTLKEQALAAFRELGDQYFQSVCLYAVGNLQAKQGDWEVGLENLRESLILSRRLGSKYESAAGLWRLAETEQHRGKSGRAVRLYCAARNVYDSIGAWQPADDVKLEERLTSCSAALSESTFAQAVGEGRTMTTDQAIEYALELSTGR